MNKRISVIWLGVIVATFGKAADADTSDWPQFRGPNRDGIVTNSPKLLDSWPKAGPPLVWKSGLVPAYRDGGASAVVVADGKVFVYANRQPKDDGESFKYVTAEVLEYLKTKELPADQIARVAKCKDVGFTSIGELARELRGVKDCDIAAGRRRYRLSSRRGLRCRDRRGEMEESQVGTHRWQTLSQ